eukprot:TRINITY_DN76427_c0_g1_i1.p1 TRINITY_DN76427_c0_g1~~TRINITY_DN76427_c0_g1_i1.p1  ORF type:complete len:201 (-),score=19.37 TRINITY_DN76427_c0_g1_i1:172-774(-)
MRSYIYYLFLFHSLSHGIRVGDSEGSETRPFEFLPDDLRRDLEDALQEISGLFCSCTEAWAEDSGEVEVEPAAGATWDDKVTEIHRSLDETIDKTKDNLRLLMERGPNLEDLLEKSEKLVATTDAFYQQARRLKHKQQGFGKLRDFWSAFKDKCKAWPVQLLQAAGCANVNAAEPVPLKIHGVVERLRELKKQAGTKGKP